MTRSMAVAYPHYGYPFPMAPRRRAARPGLGCACGCGHCETSLHGLGGAAQIVLSAGQIAGGALPSIGAAAGLWATAAIPVVGAGIAAITIALTALFSRKGPQQKVATTHIVDEIEPQLAANRDYYLAGARTISSQAQALANFDAGWKLVVDNCGQPSMGNPGIACINDRKPGGQWDWFSYYRTPIANDPQVKPDPIIPELSIIPAFVDSGNGWMLAAAGGVLVLTAVMAAVS